MKAVNRIWDRHVDTVGPASTKYALCGCAVPAAHWTLAQRLAVCILWVLLSLSRDEGCGLAP